MGCPCCVEHAVYNGYVDILNFIIQQGEVLGAQLLDSALDDVSMLDHPQVVQWLLEHGAQWLDL
jgi:hypothetical protein